MRRLLSARLRLRALGVLSATVVAMSLAAGPVAAAPVSVTPAPAPTYDISARAKWAGTSAEGQMFTPGNPSPAGVQLNPYPSPAWSVGNYHAFEFTYTMATGVATFKIDFTRDGDFLDASESASSTSPTLIGYGHKYLNLWMSGSSNAPGTVDVQNFTVNGTNLGGFTSNPNTTPIEWTWIDSSGFFGDVTVTGQYRMSASGSAGESNRMWVRLGAAQLPDATAPTAAPTQSPAANGYGWNNTDVVVNWNWTDTGTGIDPTNCTSSSTSSGEGEITLNATCKDLVGNTGSASYAVKVDKTKPDITVPADMTVSATSPSGAAVSFTATFGDPLSDLASSGCVPPSGSIFPIGMTTVTCSATDKADNSDSKTFNITVTSPNTDKQAVLAVLQSLIPSGDAKTDERILKAIERLEKSLTPSWWDGPLALDPKDGKHVFDQEKKVVHELSKKELDGNPVALQAILTIVSVDRALAQYAIDNAVDVKPSYMAKALEDMAKGDAYAASGKYENAIEHYKNAWERVTK